MNTVRQWHVRQALESYQTLQGIVNDLTEQEVLRALDVEARTRRRRSIIDRLIARASRLNEISYLKQLKGKYHAPSLVEDHDRQDQA